MASIGSIVGGAFRLLAERPGAVAVWALVYILGIAGIGYLAFSMIIGGIDPDAYEPGPALIGSMFGAFLLFNLLALMLNAVLMSAVYRVVLRPADSSMAGLRLGMDEVRMFGLILLVTIVTMVVSFIGQLLLALPVAALTAALGEGVASGLASLVLMLAYAGLWLWLIVRLSTLYPLTFYRRRISLDGAWELTSGRFWTLFPAYLAIWLLLGAVFIVLFFATFGSLFAELVRAGQDPAAAQMAVAGMVDRFAAMSPGGGIALAASWAIALAAAFALSNGAFAVATRELIEERGELAEAADETY